MTKIKELLEIKQRAYFKRYNNVATASEYPQLDDFFDLIKKYQIHHRKLTHYKLNYGKHQSKTYGDIFMCHYQIKPDLERLNHQFQIVLKHNYLAQVRNTKTKMYLEEPTKTLLILLTM